MSEEHTVTEAAAAEMIGIPVKEVSRMRRKMLVPSVDYELTGKSIRLSVAAVGKIAAGIATPEKKEGAEIVVVVPVAPEVRELVVDGTCPNPKILLCHLVQGGKVVRVRCRVRDSKHFTRGMTIPQCRMVDETLFSYEGRAPRIRGRWL